MKWSKVFVVRKGGKEETFTANSWNHAKQIRDKFVNDKDVTITPIINMDKYKGTDLPILFKGMIKRAGEEHG